MIKKKTVLVLGAGSSVDFGLPTGKTLANTISSLVDFEVRPDNDLTTGEPTLYSALLKRFGNDPQVIEAGQRIARGLPFAHSIDDFLFNHSHNPMIVAAGKIAICHAILAAESQSTLNRLTISTPQESGYILRRQSGTWLYKLFSHLQTGIQRNLIHNIFNNIAIINFNYDRCVEIFLYHALQASYGISPAEASTVMSTLTIFHPYGKVGALPWENTSDHVVDFGARLDGEEVNKLSETIKTFTEQSHDQEDLAAWRGLIWEGETVAFLGFGFHKQNVDLLRVPYETDYIPQVLATTFGSSRRDEDVYVSRIYRLFRHHEPEHPSINRGNITLSPANCSKFISDFGLSLFS